MLVACIGIKPGDAIASFPALDRNSTVFFETPDDCLRFVKNNSVSFVLVPTYLQGERKQDFVRQLKEHCPKTAVIDVNKEYDEALLVQPVPNNDLTEAMKMMLSTQKRQEKEIYIHTFGRFVVFHNGQPVSLRGKAKEILALIVTRRGKEISNEEIYSTIWEDRPYSNRNMIVYYNALRRLKQSLSKEGIRELLISTVHGQMVNTNLFDCDYYEWLEDEGKSKTDFEGEFLSEYSWGEYILSDMISRLQQ